MSQKNEKQSVSRREFIKSSVATGAGVAVAAAIPGTAVSGVASSKPEKQQDERYRLSQHIVDYYKSAAC